MPTSDARPGDRMAFAAELVLDPDDPADTDRVATEVAGHLAGYVDLAVVFVSVLLDDPARHVMAARSALGARTLIGCDAAGVIAGGHEIEHAPAVAIWAATLPGVDAVASHVSFGGESGDGEPLFPGEPEIQTGTAGLVVLADPFSFPADAWLEGLAARGADGTSSGRELPCIGGLASGATRPGTTRLYIDGDILDRGAAVLRLDGPVRIDTVVSQGCRPIGSPLIVTSAESNQIAELAGKPALERLIETLRSLDEPDRRLAQRGLQVGVVIDESRPEFGRGDFLIRSLLGIDQEDGAIAVGDVIPVGTTVQFHLRDAGSADEDLRRLLEPGTLPAAGRPEGALLFTCNGRGRGLFGVPDHDISVLEQSHPDIAVAGFFCAGEIGPVGGRNFLHGFTASMAVFAPAPPRR